MDAKVIPLLVAAKAALEPEANDTTTTGLELAPAWTRDNGGNAASDGVNTEAFAYQGKAIELLEQTDRHLLVIAPTGAGKTEVGIAALSHFGKGVYVAPTRALCYEKAKELRQRFPDARVVIGNKDHSLSVSGFNGAPFRVLTPWKLGVIAENNPNFLRQCPVIVVDEIHELDPEIEMILTKVTSIHPSIRLVGLSATVHEDDEALLAKWLGNALIVKGHERPVPLITRLVHFDSDINDEGDEVTQIRVIEGNSLNSLETVDGFKKPLERVLETVRIIREGGDDAPILIYTPYRERARELAVMLAEKFGAHCREGVVAARALPKDASDFTDTLMEVLPKGVGIHHGGCSAHEKETVYELAAAGHLKYIVTCKTLSAGINIPARHVVVESVYVEPRDGNERSLMDCSQFWQVAGRAGRPQFDTIGYLWVPVASELERVEIEEVLLKNRASKIVSRVYDEYFLSAQLPGLVRSGWSTPRKLAAFMRNTFFGATLQDVEPLTAQFERIIASLVEQGFAMTIGKVLILTDRGQRLARLGIHPSEYEAIEALSGAQNAEYEEWVRRLLDVCGEHVLERAASEEEIADVVSFGMTAHTVKTSFAVRELVDYLSRLLELAPHLLRFNDAERTYQRDFRVLIADRFQFGEMEVARKLAGVVGRVAVRRVLRNCGALDPRPTATGEDTQEDNEQQAEPLVLDDPQIRAICRALWSQEGLPDDGQLARVAAVFGKTEASFRRLANDKEVAS